MLQAIAERRDWKSGNTRVLVGNREVVVLLHGNIIAYKNRAGGWSYWSRGWATVTTASRLRALGANIKLHNPGSRGAWIEDLTTGAAL